MLSRALTSVPRRPAWRPKPGRRSTYRSGKVSKQPEPPQVVTMELDSLGLKSLDKLHHHRGAAIGYSIAGLKSLKRPMADPRQAGQFCGGKAQ